MAARQLPIIHHGQTDAGAQLMLEYFSNGYGDDFFWHTPSPDATAADMGLLAYQKAIEEGWAVCFSGTRWERTKTKSKAIFASGLDDTDDLLKTIKRKKGMTVAIYTLHADASRTQMAANLLMLLSFGVSVIVWIDDNQEIGRQHLCAEWLGRLARILD